MMNLCDTSILPMYYLTKFTKKMSQFHYLVMVLMNYLWAMKHI